MRVLIVDDNPIESEVLKRLLKRRFDAEVFEACSMREAEMIVKANNLDCIVLDLQLPDSGIDETIGRIRNLPYPVFVYSGFDDPSLRERVLNSGAEDFILKATGNASIVERIGHLQYKRKPDKKLLEGAYAARHAENGRLARGAWQSTIPKIAVAAVTVITFAAGVLMGGWNKARDAGERAENYRGHFANLDRDVAALQKSDEAQNEVLRDLQVKAGQVSTEQGHIIEWLKRIDAKVTPPLYPQLQQKQNRNQHTGR